LEPEEGTPNRLGLVPADPPVTVAWVAGKDTIDNLGYLLSSLAVGLVDSFIKLVLVCPASADIADLPCPPIEVVGYPSYTWPFRENVIRGLTKNPALAKAQLMHGLDESAVDLTRHLAGASSLAYVVSSYGLLPSRMRRFRRDMAGILAPSERVQLQLIKGRLASPEKVHLVPPGVHPAKRAICFRNPRHSVAIVFHGQLRNWRRLSALTECFAQLKQQGYDCVFMIIGSGRMESRFRKEVAALGLQQEVTFAGMPTSVQLAAIMKAADIFVSFAPGRQIGLASLVAMSSGVPSLVAGNADDFVIDGKTAISFDATSSSQLTEKLTVLLDNREKARALAKNALEYIKERHGPADIAQSVAGIYRNVIGSPKS